MELKYKQVNSLEKFVFCLIDCETDKENKYKYCSERAAASKRES